jgi:hypothetical protein
MTATETAERVAARILLHLFDAGLEPVSLSRSAVGLTGPEAAAFAAVADWLLDEGLIRGTSYRGIESPLPLGIFDAVLSGRAALALASPLRGRPLRVILRRLASGAPAPLDIRPGDILAALVQPN